MIFNINVKAVVLIVDKKYHFFVFKIYPNFVNYRHFVEIGYQFLFYQTNCICQNS